MRRRFEIDRGVVQMRMTRDMCVDKKKNIIVSYFFYLAQYSKVSKVFTRVVEMVIKIN